MKRASATAGIAGVVTGFAVMMSGVSAHATFMYLHQSQLSGAAATAGSVAQSSVAPSAADNKSAGNNSGAAADVRFGGAAVAPVADKGTAGLAGFTLLGEHAYAGLQQPFTLAGADKSVDGADDEAGKGAVESHAVESQGARHPVFSDYRWTTAWPTVNAAIVGMPGEIKGEIKTVTEPATVTLPGRSTVTVPQPATVTVPGPASVTVAQPAATVAVPEPATVGMLGLGLLLVFLGIARGKRAR